MWMLEKNKKLASCLSRDEDPSRILCPPSSSYSFIDLPHLRRWVVVEVVEFRLPTRGAQDEEEEEVDFLRRSFSRSSCCRRSHDGNLKNW